MPHFQDACPWNQAACKYRIVQSNDGAQTLWVIKSRSKVLSHHTSSAEAHETVQRYIAEDRDFAIEQD
jgi:hypothetical protein